MKGVFAWITCPQVLERLKDDLKLCYKDDPAKITEIDSLTFPTTTQLQSTDKESFCSVAKGGSVVTINNHVILEEYAFTVKNETDISALAKKLHECTGVV
ncbi:MAG: hypothetical protein CUN57_03825, partial [Phototrophicales bacterium]